MSKAKIDSGIFKGKTLNLPSNMTTRSTKSIVKGSFFDTFRYELKGKIFIECFGGSGIMAAEALSNSAKIAVAIEKDYDAFKILKDNLSFSDKFIVKRGDCFEILPEILKNFSDDMILYFDPPFEIRVGFNEIYKKLEKFIENLSQKNIFLISIEHRSGVNLSENLGNFTKFKSKKFGNTTLSYYKK